MRVSSDWLFMRGFELLVLAMVAIFVYDTQFADRPRVVEMPGKNRVVEGNFIDWYQRMMDDL